MNLVPDWFKKEIRHHFSDNLYAKEMFVPAGQAVVKHVHEFSHLSILAKGEVDLIVDGETKSISAPACINIEAEKVHGVIAKTDVIWYCIHATDEKDLDKIDQVLIGEA